MRLSYFATALAVAGVACGGETRINPTSSSSTEASEDVEVDDEVDDDDDDDDDDQVDDDTDEQDDEEEADDTDTTDDDDDDDDDEDVTNTYDDPTFGTSCTATADCGPGLVCSGLTAGETTCTVPCVGSGKGGNDDCPSGYACWNWESTSLDGVQICLADWQLGEDTTGYPFTTAPGDYCDASDNACQTSVCNTSTSTCVVQCMADRDCSSNDVCYAYAFTDSTLHICWPSDTDSYLAHGESCDSNDECDSGVCVGTCAAHCRSVEDCDSGSTCAFWPMVQTSTYYSSWVPVCVDRSYRATGALGDRCSGDDDCESEWCIDGTCTTPCATVDDCSTAMPDTECVQINFYDGDTPVYSGSFCLEP